jgi:hypothetical protein
VGKCALENVKCSRPDDNLSCHLVVVKVILSGDDEDSSLLGHDALLVGKWLLIDMISYCRSLKSLSKLISGYSS